MVETERPLLADLREETAGLAAELREMLRLRWRLARLELQSDMVSVKRLAIQLSAAAVLALMALSLGTVAAAEMLQRWSGVPRTVWLVALAAALLVAALVLGWTAWRRFRRRWQPLEETLQELCEDLVWLNEWAGRMDRERRGP
jgi:Flp pilus assembly protein TadB